MTRLRNANSALGVLLTALLAAIRDLTAPEYNFDDFDGRELAERSQVCEKVFLQVPQNGLGGVVSVRSGFPQRFKPASKSLKEWSRIVSLLRRRVRRGWQSPCI